MTSVGKAALFKRNRNKRN